MGTRNWLTLTLTAKCYMFLILIGANFIPYIYNRGNSQEYNRQKKYIMRQCFNFKNSAERIKKTTGCVQKGNQVWHTTSLDLL